MSEPQSSKPDVPLRQLENAPPAKLPVRRRTLDLVRNLLARDAAAGAAAFLPGCVAGCDPPPPPAMCDTDTPSSDFLQHIFPTARWNLLFFGEPRIELEVVVSNWLGKDELAIDGEPTLVNATLIAIPQPQNYILLLEDDAAFVDISLPILCYGVPEELNIRIDTSGPRINTAELPIAAND